MCKEKKRDIALRRYSIIMSYFQYENTAFWMRINLFLIALILMVGTIGQMLKDYYFGKNTITDFFITFLLLNTAICIVFIMVSFLFGKNWTDHWHSILCKLEKDAFENIDILRESASKKGVTPQILSISWLRDQIVVLTIMYFVLLVGLFLILHFK